MSNYSRPGVFVNTSLTPLTSSPSGVTGGAVACFVGAYNRGPTQPTLVTSWQNFANLYGGFNVANGSPLAYAVWQYFSNGGSACYVYRVPNTDAVVSSLAVGSVEPTQAALAAPGSVTPTTATSGGTVAAGTYQVQVTYVDSFGETTASASHSIVTTGSASTITIPSPPSESPATGWYAYVTQAGGSTYTRQQTAGSPTTIGTPLVITAPPTSSGAAPPSTNTTASTTSEVANLLTFISNSPGAYGNTLYTEIVAGASSLNDPTSVFTVNVYLGGTAAANLVETWPAVSLNPGSARNLVSMMNASIGGSNFVSAKVAFASGSYVAGDGSSDPMPQSPTALTGGSDGTVAPSLDTAITTGLSASGGNPWNSPGLGSLSNVVLNVNLPAGPSAGIAQTVLNNVITWAENQGNVFVIIDAPFGGVPLLSSSQLVTSYQSYLTTGTAISASPNAAIYGPWLSIKDPASAAPTATAWVAPGGAVLGVWAQNDTNYNLSHTPAGTSATVGAVALEGYFTPADLSNLETMQVNPIKQIPGSGLCVFGGRTLGTGYPNRYINVSRTLMQFTTDFVNITQFAIFQNNDPSLWQSITTVLSNYLMQAMQAGMLASTTPETSFSVVCDGTTTSAAQAQAGIVNAQVAVALASPAEFIIINLSQMQGGGSATVSS
jgi:hypothetical protein